MTKCNIDREKKEEEEEIGRRKPKNGADAHRRWRDIEAEAELIDICLHPTNNGRLIVVNTIDLVVYLDARIPLLSLRFISFRFVSSSVFVCCCCFFLLLVLVDYLLRFDG